MRRELGNISFNSLANCTRRVLGSRDVVIRICIKHTKLPLCFWHPSAEMPVTYGQHELRACHALAYFWVLLAGVRILVINMRPRHGCVVILQLDLMPQLRLLLPKLVWKRLPLCTSHMMSPVQPKKWPSHVS